MYEGNLSGRDNRWGGGAVWLVQRSNLGFGFVWGFKIKLPVEVAEGQREKVHPASATSAYGPPCKNMNEK